MTKKKLIQRLKDRFDSIRLKRIADQEAERVFKDRVADIFAAPRYVKTDFWCDTCKKDCVGVGFRQVCTIRERYPTAWFTAYCPEGHRMIRRITDKGTDPYYEKSMMIARHRQEFADALLTPDDPRFKVLYPKQYKELMEKNAGK